VFGKTCKPFVVDGKLFKDKGNQVTYKYGEYKYPSERNSKTVCHYHPDRKGVQEVVMLKVPNHFICERCAVEDSALEAEVRTANGECQECGCKTYDFSENCDHCDTFLFYSGIEHQCASETRYEKQQLSHEK
jgi:hypothetical protein